MTSELIEPLLIIAGLGMIPPVVAIVMIGSKWMCDGLVEWLDLELRDFEANMLTLIIASGIVSLFAGGIALLILVMEGGV